MHFAASYYIIQSQGCHILSCFKPKAESPRQLKAVCLVTQCANCAGRMVPGDLGQFSRLTFLGSPQVLLAVHAVAAPSASSLCQAGICLWKLCWSCLGTAPNSHSSRALPGKGDAKVGIRNGGTQDSKSWVPTS